MEILRRYAEKTAKDPLERKVRLTEKLEKNGYSIIEAERTTFKPIKLRNVELKLSEYELIDKNENALVPITSLSVLVRSLPDAWLKDLQFYVFLVNSEGIDDKGWALRIEECKGKVKETLAELYSANVLF